MDELYDLPEFEGLKWKIAPPELEHVSINKVDEFRSWGVYTVPARFVECGFNNLALRKCLFSNQQFIECDFSEIDASDSSFIDCFFLNCTFNHANFGKTSFIGSAIVQTGEHVHKPYFANAGMSQSRFLPSDQISLLMNIKFHGLGFRYSVFNKVVMRNMIVDHTSFENALFELCDIDFLKLSDSSCRGIVFKNCKIERFISTLEKTVGSIGGLEMLDNINDFELKIEDDIIGNKDDLAERFENALNRNEMTFVRDGNLFEYVNIMYYLYLHPRSKRAVYENDKYDLALAKKEIIDGFRTSELGQFLFVMTFQAHKSLKEKGEDTDLDNVLYLLKLMYFLEIDEYKFWEFVRTIYEELKNAKQPNYADFLTTSQIDYYLNEVGSKIKKDTFLITILNESISWENQAERLEFQRVIDLLFHFSDDNNHKLLSLHEGSVEVVIDLVDPDNWLITSFLIGIEIDYSTESKWSFRFSPRKAIKSYAELLKSIPTITKFFGDRKITQKKFDKIAKSNPDLLLKYLEEHNVSVGAERETASNKWSKKRNNKDLPSEKNAIASGKKMKK